MNKKFTTLVLISTIFLSSTAQAENQLLTLEAMRIYATSCTENGGTAATSNDGGYSWQPVNLQEVTYAAKHARQLVEMNAIMRGEKLTKEQMDEYLNTSAPKHAKSMEHADVLTCHGATITLANQVEVNNQQNTSPQPKTYKNISDNEWESLTGSAEYYFDFNADSDKVRGFGQIKSPEDQVVFEINADCSNSEENYHVGEIYSTKQKKIIQPSQEIQPTENTVISALKDQICSLAYGRNYN